MVGRLRPLVQAPPDMAVGAALAKRSVRLQRIQLVIAPPCEKPVTCTRRRSIRQTPMASSTNAATRG